MKQIIMPSMEQQVHERLEELLVRSRQLARPLFPKMTLEFRITPNELYFSTVGKLFWNSPFWRGESFTVFIMLHEGFHWVLYPVDVFRALKELYEAREALANEIGFQPNRKLTNSLSTQSDWSGFPYPLSEFQLAQNILADYIVNLYIHDHYPFLWNEFWVFVTDEDAQSRMGDKEREFYKIYLLGYHLLRGDVERMETTKEEEAVAREIVKIVKLSMEKRMSTKFAIKEIVKLLHPTLECMKESGDGLTCPNCGNEKWSVVAYKEKDQWVRCDGDGQTQV